MYYRDDDTWARLVCIVHFIITQGRAHWPYDIKETTDAGR